jgi:hypothetical protein
MTRGDAREEALAQAADVPDTMVANCMAEGWDYPRRCRRGCGRSFSIDREIGLDRTNAPFATLPAGRDVR